MGIAARPFLIHDLMWMGLSYRTPFEYRIGVTFKHGAGAGRVDSISESMLHTAQATAWDRQKSETGRTRNVTVQL